MTAAVKESNEVKSSQGVAEFYHPIEKPDMETGEQRNDDTDG